jgi:hypothetical protein
MIFKIRIRSNSDRVWYENNIAASTRRKAMPTRKLVYHQKNLSPQKKKKPVVTVAEAFGEPWTLPRPKSERMLSTFSRNFRFFPTTVFV